MGYSPVKVFTVTMTSGTTFSTMIDMGTSYEGYILEVPSMSSGGNIYIQGAEASDGTFRRVYFKATSTTAAPVQVLSSVSNALVPIDTRLPQFVRIELSTATADAVYKFRIFGHN